MPQTAQTFLLSSRCLKPELLFTHQEKEKEAEGLTMAARKLTVRRGKTVRALLIPRWFARCLLPSQIIVAEVALVRRLGLLLVESEIR
jgi:hypothetical protein